MCGFFLMFSADLFIYIVKQSITTVELPKESFAPPSIVSLKEISIGTFARTFTFNWKNIVKNWWTMICENNQLYLMYLRCKIISNISTTTDAFVRSTIIHNIHNYYYFIYLSPIFFVVGYIYEHRSNLSYHWHFGRYWMRWTWEIISHQKHYL